MLLVRQMLSKFILHTMKIMNVIVFADISHVINFFLSLPQHPYISSTAKFQLTMLMGKFCQIFIGI